jgi:citrate lyase subunit beta/citryl-CoA lyase
MPAVNDRALQKGPSLDADAIIVDLEDSVHPDVKVDARKNVVRTFNELDFGHRLRVVRVNAVDSVWFKDDMHMLHDVKPDAVLLPKVETPAAISIAHQHLQNIPGAASTNIWAMMETPIAVINASVIAASKNQINEFTTVCIGNNDLAREADMTVTSDRQLLIPWLLQIVLACKAHKLQVMDGVYNDFSDLSGFEQECVQGASMGMSGKTLIHPKQIAAANAAYSPSAEAIAQAQTIVDAFAKPENADLGAIKVNGAMVERLHLDMAQHTLRIAQQLKTRS